MLLRRRLLLLFVGIVAGVLILGIWMAVTLRERDTASQQRIAIDKIARSYMDLGVFP